MNQTIPQMLTHPFRQSVLPFSLVSFLLHTLREACFSFTLLTNPLVRHQGLDCLPQHMLMAEAIRRINAP